MRKFAENAPASISGYGSQNANSPVTFAELMQLMQTHFRDDFKAKRNRMAVKQQTRQRMLAEKASALPPVFNGVDWGDSEASLTALGKLSDELLCGVEEAYQNHIVVLKSCAEYELAGYDAALVSERKFYEGKFYKEPPFKKEADVDKEEESPSEEADADEERGALQMKVDNLALLGAHEKKNRKVDFLASPEGSRTLGILQERVDKPALPTKGKADKRVTESMQILDESIASIQESQRQCEKNLSMKLLEHDEWHTQMKLKLQKWHKMHAKELQSVCLPDERLTIVSNAWMLAGVFRESMQAVGAKPSISSCERDSEWNDCGFALVESIDDKIEAIKCALRPEILELEHSSSDDGIPVSFYMVDGHFSSFDVERWSSKVQEALKLGKRGMEIKEIREGSVEVLAIVFAVDLAALHRRLELLNQTMATVVTVGDLDFEILTRQAGMNRIRPAHQFDKIYCVPAPTWALGGQEVVWTGPNPVGMDINTWYAGRPYYCPRGWKKWALEVAANHEEFDRQWRQHHVAYHGCSAADAATILQTHLRASHRGCHVSEGVPRVYLTPSIIYASHPRYATPLQLPDRRWAQVVLQCRIAPHLVNQLGPKACGGGIGSETLRVGDAARIDPNIPNSELEWVIRLPLGETRLPREHFICYAILVRVAEGRLGDIPENAWWAHTEPPNYAVDPEFRAS